MELRESSKISTHHTVIRRIAAAGVLTLALAVMGASTASAQEFDAVTYDLDVSKDGAVSLEAVFAVAEAGDSAQHSMAVSGASSLPVKTGNDDGLSTYTIEIEAPNPDEFAAAYQAWAGTEPSVQVRSNGGDFFAENRIVQGNLPAPTFVEGNPAVTTHVAVTSGARAIPGTAITKGDSKVSGVNMTLHGQFPVDFQAEFTKSTTQGTILNLAVGGAILAGLIYALRALLSNWDRNARKERKAQESNAAL